MSMPFGVKEVVAVVAVFAVVPVMMKMLADTAPDGDVQIRIEMQDVANTIASTPGNAQIPTAVSHEAEVTADGDVKTVLWQQAPSGDCLTISVTVPSEWLLSGDGTIIVSALTTSDLCQGET
jgi:hypothetical protein